MHENKVKVSEKIAPAVTKYYLKVAKRYRFMQIMLMLGLVGYIFVIVSAFGQYITYDNLRYLLRDFGTISKEGEGDFSRIRYDRQGEQTFAVFKNGIAVAGKEFVEVFDSAGLRLCSERTGYGDPVAVPSEKYLLLYDMGGTGYSVYNSLTRVIARTESHKIVDGDMSDTGAFILVTRSGETKYVVKHFGQTLTHTMSIYKDNYVMDAAISRDGRRVVICSAVPAHTDFDCEIALHAEGETEALAKITIPSAMPLSVYFGDEGFTVLCDNGLYFYDKNGTERASHRFSGVTLQFADTSADRVVIAASENALGSENRIMVFDNMGNLLVNGLLRERVTAISAPSGRDGDTLAYVLTPTDVLKLTPAEEAEGAETSAKHADFAVEEADLSGDDVLAIRAAARGVIVCTATGAYYRFN